MNGKKKCKYCGQELKNDNNVVCERCALYLIDAICEDEEEKSKSEDDLKAEYKAIAERRVRLGLLLAEIANENKITLTQDDLTKAVMQEARRYPGQEKIVFEYYQKNPQALDALKAPLFEEKVVDYVLTVVKINEENLSADELYAYNPDTQKK